MTVRHYVNQHGIHVHVGGRKRPTQTRESHPHLYRSLRQYMTGTTLPTAPDTFDFTGPAASALAMILANGPDPTAPPQVAGTGLGDCTAAGPGHIIDVVTANAGDPVVISAADAVKFYGLSTGYIIGDEATDQGGDEITVCTYWQQHGYDGNGAHKIAGWAALTDAELVDVAFVKSMAWLFPMMFGIELATSWTQIAGNGFVWDIGEEPNPSDGHCVITPLAANARGLIVDSWGFLGTITWAAIAKFCANAAGGNLFAILTPEIVNAASQKAPSGFDYAALLADLDGFGGNAPATAPTPAPPVVVPTGPATLANVQAWVAAGIQGGDPLQSQADAIANANAGLAKYWPSGS